MLGVTVVSEVTIQVKPKLNVDYVAFRLDQAAEDGVDVIAIETQAIDLRGGGVGPAWRAWEAGEPERWRAYFSEEAAAKGRKDDVAYGVNTGNVYKRLGTQVADKGAHFSTMNVPLFVVTQHRIYEQLTKRVRFPLLPDSQSDEGIIFMTFDYGPMDDSGMFVLQPKATDRTTYVDYVQALRASSSTEKALRADFLDIVKRKAQGLRGPESWMETDEDGAGNTR